MIVSLARDTQAPVRITYEPCSDDGFPVTRILDYLSFDELPQTSGNLRRLELSPHPGVPVVDGIEIDKREERSDPAQNLRPTPTPRASPDRHGSWRSRSTSAAGARSAAARRASQLVGDLLRTGDEARDRGRAAERPRQELDLEGRGRDQRTQVSRRGR